jgi:hypothetical protein
MAAKRVKSPTINNNEQKNSAKVAKPNDSADPIPKKSMNLCFFSAKCESLSQPWGNISKPKTNLKIKAAKLNATGE